MERMVSVQALAPEQNESDTIPDLSGGIDNEWFLKSVGRDHHIRSCINFSPSLSFFLILYFSDGTVTITGTAGQTPSSKT